MPVASQSMIDDPGEIAQLASEFVSSLDNLPQEIQHILKEVEHKDAKVQDILPKIAAREAQLRELLGRRDTTLNDGEKLKAEKIMEKIKEDYAMTDQYNAEKESLAKEAWRIISAQYKRLDVEIGRIAPSIVEQTEKAVAGTLPSQEKMMSSGNISNVILANLKSSTLDTDATSNPLKRKHGRDSPAQFTPGRGIRQSSTDRLASPSPIGTPTSSTATSGLKKGVKYSNLSSMVRSRDAGDAEADGDLDINGGEEKDDKVYCHCQRVSFGEMIGCDSDECPYEWFHLSCVGLSKPLPQTWYCSDCRERMEREKTERPMKKRKKKEAPV